MHYEVKHFNTKKSKKNIMITYCLRNSIVGKRYYCRNMVVLKALLLAMGNINKQ